MLPCKMKRGKDMTEFKIGDKVRFDAEDLKGTGEILALAHDHVIVKAWIVSIETRDTEFLKNRPEKAWICLETYLKLIEE